MKSSYDLIIIGGGPAGLAAAIAAYDAGIRDLLVLERESRCGGILNQCIHNGFGLRRFGESLTGPEYALRFLDEAERRGIPMLTDTTVLSLREDKSMTVTSATLGIVELRAKAVVLAMGCRERSKGALCIAGSRPAGLYSAGAAQKYVNRFGYLPGRDVVILGSGDIGLIMARRMTLEGAKVLACVELMPYSSGLNRNIVQCLNDYDIPLYLSHTVTDIRGRDRLEQVVVSRVGEDRRPIPGSEITFDCDTLLLSVGLIPENELSRKAGIEIDRRTNGPIVYENMETSIPGVFACGNVVHVHDLVDYVTAESERAGRAAAAFVLGDAPADSETVSLVGGNAVTYTVPQHIRRDRISDKVEIFFRVNRTFERSRINVCDGQGSVASFNRNHMAPGEMEHIVIPKKLLDRAVGDITVSCEEVSE